MQQYQPWHLAFLRDQGYADASPLAVGMEGAIYRLGNHTVAKFWWEQQFFEQLELVAGFYEQLNAELIGLRAPLIVDVLQHDGRLVSIERELDGQPMNTFISQQSPNVASVAISATVAVLEALHGIDIPSAKELRVLDEAVSPWAGHQDWPDAIVALIHRRMERFGDKLRVAVPSFDARLGAVLDALGHSSGALSVVHGDLVPEDLALYKAVYGLVTSNAYDVLGQDGHFAWCARMIERVPV